ncbi:hypothetical protein U1Q18_043580, partial [Sarracenia purpurea var. burkii]
IEGGATGVFVSDLNLKSPTKEIGNLNVFCEEVEGTEQEKAEARGNKLDCAATTGGATSYNVTPTGGLVNHTAIDKAVDYDLVIAMVVLLVSFVLPSFVNAHSGLP